MLVAQATIEDATLVAVDAVLTGLPVPHLDLVMDRPQMRSEPVEARLRGAGG
jgi:hypothetical protein